MDKNNVIDVLNFMHENKFINDWVFETILGKLEDFDSFQQNIDSSIIQENIEIKEDAKNNNEIKKEEKVETKIEIANNNENEKAETKITINTSNINEILPAFAKIIYEIYNSTEGKNFYTLTQVPKVNKGNNPDSFFINLNFAKKDKMVEMLTQKYETLNLSELIKEYNSINEKWKKINLRDRMQKNNWINKIKELMVISKLLGSKDENNKQKWNKVNLDLSILFKKNNG